MHCVVRVDSDAKTRRSNACPRRDSWACNGSDPDRLASSIAARDDGGLSFGIILGDGERCVPNVIRTTSRVLDDGPLRCVCIIGRVHWNVGNAATSHDADVIHARNDARAEGLRIAVRPARNERPRGGAVRRFVEATRRRGKDVVARVVVRMNEKTLDAGVEQAVRGLRPVQSEIGALEYTARCSVVLPAGVNQIRVRGRRSGRGQRSGLTAHVLVVEDVTRTDTGPLRTTSEGNCRGKEERCD